MSRSTYAPYNNGSFSNSLWKRGRFDFARLLQDPNLGYYYSDDFVNFSQHISDQSVQRYDSYIDSGVTIKQLTGTAGRGGAIEIAGNDADNDEGVLSTHGPAFMVSDSTKKALAFEAIWSKASVADNALASFIGLGFDHGNSVPVAKTLCLTDDDGALGAFSFIGFHVDQADGDALDFVYKADGQSAVVKIAGVQALVAATTYRLGFLFDPDRGADKQIAIFVDGVEQSTYVTAANIAAATFPDDEPLAMVWAAKVGTGSAEVKSQLYGWRCAQLL
jgi:hypothetical protein